MNIPNAEYDAHQVDAKLRRAGFTIVELLIVIVIIAILAAITMVSYNGIQQRARDSSRSSGAETIQKALALYYVDNSSYPDACGGYNVGCTIDKLSPSLTPKYISVIPSDSASKIIQYVVSSDYQSYGILVPYEAKDQCKIFEGPTAAGGWWGYVSKRC